MQDLQTIVVAAVVPTNMPQIEAYCMKRHHPETVFSADTNNPMRGCILDEDELYLRYMKDYS